MTREQTLVTYEYIRIQTRRKKYLNYSRDKSPMVPSFRRLELP